MKRALPERVISPLPKNLEVLKRDFQKVKNMFFARNKVVVEKAEYEFEWDKVAIPIESKALFWILLQEFENFINEHEAELTEGMIKELEEKGTKEIPLYEYGVKVVFDDEAKWFFKKELTKDDWAVYDKKCNEELKKKNKD